MQALKRTSEIEFENVFILGIGKRSGTNYVRDLICLHPDCVRVRIPEDYLLHFSKQLVRYENRLYKRWGSWRDKFPDGSLLKYLGNGLLSFIEANIAKGDLKDGDVGSEKLLSKKIVTKTPSVENLKYFFDLFPYARLVILVRDGRSVAESAVKSFGISYETAIQAWADSAKKIIEFDRDSRSTNKKYIVVRYEDILKNTEYELNKIFSFLGLNSEIYDFNKALDLPVKGSSQLQQKGDKEIHWRPVSTEELPDFDPLSRFCHWNRSLHERFNWITGDCLEELGYKKKIFYDNKFFWGTLNFLLDIKWFCQSSIMLFLKRIKL